VSAPTQKTPTQHISQKSLTDRQIASTTIIVGIVLITRAHVHVRSRAAWQLLGVTFFVAGFASTTLAARLASHFLLAILPPKYAMSK
jgi:hypothetical protein